MFPVPAGARSTSAIKVWEAPSRPLILAWSSAFTYVRACSRQHDLRAHRPTRPRASHAARTPDGTSSSPAPITPGSGSRTTATDSAAHRGPLHCPITSAGQTKGHSLRSCLPCHVPTVTRRLSSSSRHSYLAPPPPPPLRPPPRHLPPLPPPSGVAPPRRTAVSTARRGVQRLLSRQQARAFHPRWVPQPRIGTGPTSAGRVSGLPRWRAWRRGGHPRHQRSSGARADGPVRARARASMRADASRQRTQPGRHVLLAVRSRTAPSPTAAERSFARACPAM